MRSIENVDVLLPCSKGLDREKGLMESNEEEAAVKQIMLQQGRKALLLADNSKFDKTAFVKICDLADIDTLVTDKAPGEAWDEPLAQKQVKLIH